jgi:dihydrolipoamide dehydrogenase
MADINYDVLVIGSGPGGYVAAIRAAQLGLKTACAEGRETLGGTCLNVGCIPSKAMLHASELYEEAHSGALKKFGINIDGATLDLDQMHAEKTKAVTELTGGIAFLFKKNKVDWLKGYATFESANTVKVGDQTITAKNIIIATGSSVTPLPGVAVDNDAKIIVDSTGALALPKVPSSSAAGSSGSNSAASGNASAPRSPSSNISTKSSPGWTRKSAPNRPSCSRNRASTSASGQKSPAPLSRAARRR